MTKKEKPFEEALVEAIDEGLLILGESGRDAVYFHLQHSYGIRKEDIPDNPEIFVECLRKIFGLGAQVIERSIIKVLCSKLGIGHIEDKNYNFTQYLNEIKMRLE